MSFFVEASDVDPKALFKIVKPDACVGSKSGIQLIELADELGLDIQVLNNNVSPAIIALVDKQKFEYEQKKAKKEQEKKSKANAQKLKEIKFHVNISENDINTKIGKILDFLEKNCKVKLVLELRGRENGMDDYAKEKFCSILSKLSSFNLEEVKKINNSFFTFVTK